MLMTLLQISFIMPLLEMRKESLKGNVARDLVLNSQGEKRHLSWLICLIMS